MPLGVLHPVLNDFDELLQEAQATPVASRERFLGEIDGGGIVLAIGQPALEVAHQIGIEPADGEWQLQHALVQARLNQWWREGFHLTGGDHLKGLCFLQEARPRNRVSTCSHELVELTGFGADRQLEINQALEAVGPGPQAKAMGAQQDGLAVAVVEAVD